MLDSNQPLMLKKILEDDFYTFDTNYIFEQIEKNLKRRFKGLDLSDLE